MKKVLFIMLLLPVACFCQKKEQTKIYPRAIVSGGIAGGEMQSAGVVQLSGGISYGGLFAGAGIGFDTYRYNSIPVFADLGFRFGPKRILNVYINGGYHFLNPTQKQNPTNNWWGIKYELKNGFFGEAGLGFRLKASRYHHIGLNVGYRHKRVSWSETWESNCPGCEGYIVKEIYGLNTIVSRITWEIGQ